MENTTELLRYFIKAEKTDSCDSYKEYFQSLYESRTRPKELTIEQTETIRNMYRIFVPILLFLCALGLIFNGILVAVGSLKRSGLRSRSPILILSLNLAATDSLATLFFAIGLFCNSYLRVVHEISIIDHWPIWGCILAIVEILRLSALVASALHLLSLALVHYKGIVNPLHYRSMIFCSQHRTRSIYLMSFLCWFIPFSIFCVYFSSFACDGFRSAQCSTHFILSFKFRVIVLCEFIIPLMFMFFLYIKIFLIIKRHQEQRLTRQQSTTGNRISLSRPTSSGNVLENSIKKKAIPLGDNNTVENEPTNYQTIVIPTKPLICSSEHYNESDKEKKDKNSCNNRKTLSENGNGRKKKIKSHQSLQTSIFGTMNNIIPKEANNNIEAKIMSTGVEASVRGILKQQSTIELDSSSADISVPATSGHAKALVTTLLILGTYTICWMPAVVYFGLTCSDYCPFPIQNISKHDRFYISFFANGLIIFKTLIDPFIYTYRMKEMKAALNRYVRLPFTNSFPSSDNRKTIKQVLHVPRGLTHNSIKRKSNHDRNEFSKANTNNQSLPGETYTSGNVKLISTNDCQVARNFSTIIALNSRCISTVAKVNLDSTSCCDL